MPQRSRHFYNNILGLTLIDETQYAIILQSKNTTIRIQKTEQVVASPYTSLGWEVESIIETVVALGDAGVRFELFDGLAQDDLGIWNVPGGSKVAWFRDPDGNLLSLTQN